MTKKTAIIKGILGFLLFFLADQGTKLLAVRNLKGKESVELIPGVLEILAVSPDGSFACSRCSGKPRGQNFTQVCRGLYLFLPHSFSYLQRGGLLRGHRRHFDAVQRTCGVQRGRLFFSKMETK